MYESNIVYCMMMMRSLCVQVNKSAATSVAPSRSLSMRTRCHPTHLPLTMSQQQQWRQRLMWASRSMPVRRHLGCLVAGQRDH